MFQASYGHSNRTTSFSAEPKPPSHTPHLVILPYNESVIVVLLFLTVTGYVDL